MAGGLSPKVGKVKMANVRQFVKSIDAENPTPSEVLNARGGVRFTNPLEEAEMTQRDDSGPAGEADLGVLGSERLIPLLASYPLLGTLSRAELAKLATEVVTVDFEPAEEIVLEGEKGDAMYFVDTGEAFAEVKGVGIVYHYSRGGFFGELALTGDLPRIATVRSGGRGCRCLSIKADAFHAVSSNNEEVLRILEQTNRAHSRWAKLRCVIRHPVWHKEDGGNIKSAWADELKEEQQQALLDKAEVHYEKEAGREGGYEEFEEPEHTGLVEQTLTFTGPGNVAAGLTSALHVNLYLAALGMMLATNYFDVMGVTMACVMGTALMQGVHTKKGSYRHFVISNADTVPGAVMVEIVQAIVKSCEKTWELTQEYRLKQYIESNPKEAEMDWDECIQLHPEVCEPCWENHACWMRVHTTIVVGIMLSSFVTGFVLYGLGKLRWGNLISFVPLTVEAAFLAGVGWKITKTGVFFLLDKNTLLSGNFSEFSVDILYNAVPMLVMGVFIMWAEKTFHHSKLGQWILPGLLIGLTAAFYAFVFVMMHNTGQTWDDLLADARSPEANGTFRVLPDGRGWLMDKKTEFTWDPLPQFYPVWDPPLHVGEIDLLATGHFNQSEVQPGEHAFVDVLDADFAAIFNLNQLINLAILIIVTVLAILLNSSAIEEETGSNIDFDRELKITGMGNMLSAGLCGSIGYSSVGKTMLCHSMGGHYFSGLFSVAYYVSYIAVGNYLARFVPLPVLGAFIFAIGMELLLEWLVHYRKRVTRVEYKETVALFLIMTLHFVVGFFIGMFFSLIVFASRYADVPVIKAVMDGSEYQGRSTFTGHDTMVLRKWGCKILTVRLQGFIFFFTAERLRSDLLHLIAQRKLPNKKVEYLILDFRFVENFDSTSIQKLFKLLRTCEQEHKISCMVTNLQGNLKHRMEEVIGAPIKSVKTDIEDMVKAASAHSSQQKTNYLGAVESTSMDELIAEMGQPGNAVDPTASLGGHERDTHGQHHDHGHEHASHGHDDHLNWGKLLYLFDSDDAIELALLGLLSQTKYNPKLLRKDKSCEEAGRWTLPCVVRSILDYQRAGLKAMVVGQLFDTCQFRKLGEVKTWRSGDIIRRQGEWSHQTLWYICNGQVATFRTHTDKTISKTELRHRGTIVGETGFFIDQPRYGTLQVTEDGTTTVAFTLENYRELAKEHPTMAEHLHMYVVDMQTECIKRQAHEINMLLRPAQGVEKEPSHALS